MLRGRSSSGDSWERNCGVPLSRAELGWCGVTRPGSLSRMESRVASTAASSGIKPWNLKKVMRFDHSASSSNLQEELIALVTDCKVAVTA